ncbi:NADH:flavin oxidoreductase/NADH oxidase family protein [Jannaschia seohaensis]|uniref:2,4-dienoyl-CoA reductase n=1 Tax=Jannaschia seohaensis TaxID=475081 RepID=A0A2Y9AJ48_9RHOB|nr:NADH:flavin oxidoreductase/NADH oxidase family protein [Jannaschia seohaensis]PWJ20186.1 2,4-dienoyl-CoA reductase-like NADH-dependent reductase (Old Yellow Enzyme family) [Jannaschia seohaensis]SSA44165.1 2,4-dienoyl-CoA reductase [Jannaschia seohaensis]
MTALPNLFAPLTLPNGLRLKNRIVKSAMSDMLGDGRGNPTPDQARLYERWAEGGVAASIIGEVQGDPRFPEAAGNLVLDAASDKTAFRTLARRGSANGASLWVQLGHAGALTPRDIGKPVGPSAIDLPELQARALTTQEIRALPGQFAVTARRAEALGFGGVQIHAAHGFLLSQFLSPLFNRRGDRYGGSLENRMRLLIEVTAAVRSAVSPDFVVALKLNSSDGLQGGFEEHEALRVIAALDRSGLDLIDISGGTYFPGAPASSDRVASGPYFVDFAKRVRRVTTLPLMATGGFKTHAEAESAIVTGAVDAVGIARALVLDPSLAKAWAQGDPGPQFPRFQSTKPGGLTAWYTMAIRAVSEERAPPSLDIEVALGELSAISDAQNRAWRARFGIDAA